MQQEYSQPPILLSPHFRWVVNLYIPPYPFYQALLEDRAIVYFNDPSSPYTSLDLHYQTLTIGPTLPRPAISDLRAGDYIYRRGQRAATISGDGPVRPPLTDISHTSGRAWGLIKGFRTPKVTLPSLKVVRCWPRFRP